MRAADTITVTPALSIAGALRVPGDKSISHRYALLAAIADGRSVIANYSPGADCASTLSCLQSLGVSIDRVGAGDHEPPLVSISGRGLNGLEQSNGPLDCGNSGSTMRMLAGVVAAHAFDSTLIGDTSLTRRPMRRVMEPLSRMGATFEAAPGDRPPVIIHGAPLQGIDFEPDVPSA